MAKRPLWNVRRIRRTQLYVHCFFIEHLFLKEAFINIIANTKFLFGQYTEQSNKSCHICAIEGFMSLFSNRKTYSTFYFKIKEEL